MLENPSRAKGLADISHLFLSRPHSWEGPSPDTEAAERGQIPTLHVTSAFDLLGMSVIALNLAVDLGIRGIRTTLADADPAAPIAHFIAGDAVVHVGGRTCLPLGSGRLLSITGNEGDVEPGSRCLVINSPSDRWCDGTAAGVRNLLLVTSPSIQECLQGFTIVKRAAAAAPGLRLGIIVTDVACDGAGRALFEKFAVVLSRHTSAAASYCGWLAPGDRTGPSVRLRVPALLASLEPDLSDRLRRIGAAARGIFGLPTPGRHRRGGSPAVDPHACGLTDEEIADLLMIMHPRSPWRPGYGIQRETT